MSLPNVYLRAPPTPPAAALQQRDDFVALVQRLAAQRATMLTEIEQLLVDLVRLGNVRSELKALLIKQLGSLGQLDLAKSIDRKALILPLLHSNKDNHDDDKNAEANFASREALLHSVVSTIVRQRPEQLGEVMLKRDVIIFDEFFTGNNSDDNKRILKWFSNFQFEGAPTLGAMALEHFAFTQRDWFWDKHMYWLSSRAITPVVAATQRHLMLQLDVISSVRSLLIANRRRRSHSHRDDKDDRSSSPHEFWSSPEWNECVQQHAKELFALDTEFWVSRVLADLTHHSTSPYWRLVELYLADQPITVQIQRHFPALSDQDLIRSLRTIGKWLQSTPQTLKQTLADALAACVIAFVVERDDFARLLLYSCLLESSAHFLRIFSDFQSGEKLRALRLLVESHRADLRNSTPNDMDCDVLDEFAHSELIFKRRTFPNPVSQWPLARLCLLEALLIQINVTHAIEQNVLTERTAEELFVREGISCEVVEVSRSKKVKSKKDKKGKKDKGEKKKREIVVEFLGWRLQPGGSIAKRHKLVPLLEDGEIAQHDHLEPPATQPSSSSLVSSLLYTLQDLPQWFHDAWLEQTLS